MIIDSSAIIAILLREPGYERLMVAFESARVVGVGAPTLVETGIVLTARLGPAGMSILSRFLQESGAVIVPFGPAHWQTAVDAFDRFGKGRHPAALNFGDCLSYATATMAGQPLLAVGLDFPLTDLQLA